MPRVLGVDIPGRKKIEYSLRYVYGVGPKRALDVCKECRIDPAKKADDLTAEEIARVVAFVQNNYTVEGDLRREIQSNIRRLISIGSYRGTRHRKGLPVRGQRTSTNARTRMGPRKTVGAVGGKEARAAAN